MKYDFKQETANKYIFITSSVLILQHIFLFANMTQRGLTSFEERTKKKKKKGGRGALGEKDKESVKGGGRHF